MTYNGGVIAFRHGYPPLFLLLETIARRRRLLPAVRNPRHARVSPPCEAAHICRHASAFRAGAAGAGDRPDRRDRRGALVYVDADVALGVGGADGGVGADVV